MYLKLYSDLLKTRFWLKSNSMENENIMLVSLCTSQVGAGTNPLEGAALGISLLESLAESGPLLTIATTHHGELKTLKYRYVMVFFFFGNLYVIGLLEMNDFVDTEAKCCLI